MASRHSFSVLLALVTLVLAFGPLFARAQVIGAIVDSTELFCNSDYYIGREYAMVVQATAAIPACSPTSCPTTSFSADFVSPSVSLTAGQSFGLSAFNSQELVKFRVVDAGPIEINWTSSVPGHTLQLFDAFPVQIPASSCPAAGGASFRQLELEAGFPEPPALTYNAWSVQFMLQLPPAQALMGSESITLRWHLRAVSQPTVPVTTCIFQPAADPIITALEPFAFVMFSCDYDQGVLDSTLSYELVGQIVASTDNARSFFPPDPLLTSGGGTMSNLAASVPLGQAFALGAGTAETADTDPTGDSDVPPPPSPSTSPTESDAGTDSTATTGSDSDSDSDSAGKPSSDGADWKSTAAAADDDDEEELDSDAHVATDAASGSAALRPAPMFGIIELIGTALLAMAAVLIIALV